MYTSKDEDITLCIDLTRSTLFHILPLKLEKDDIKCARLWKKLSNTGK